MVHRQDDGPRGFSNGGPVRVLFIPEVDHQQDGPMTLNLSPQQLNTSSARQNEMKNSTRDLRPAVDQNG